MFVADFGNNRIQKFTNDGAFITSWGSSGSGPGQFSGPAYTAVDANGNVFVTDLFNSRVEKFTNDGGFVTAWGSYGARAGQFNWPGGIAVDPAGNVFVVDHFNSRIEKFTNGGSFISKWGSQGSGNGQFEYPWCVAVDASGNVYVADSGDEAGETDNDNNRIEKFTNDGRFITTWGSYGLGDGQFNYPLALAVDPLGNVFVNDEYNSRIEEFAACGVGDEGCQNDATAAAAPSVRRTVPPFPAAFRPVWAFENSRSGVSARKQF